MNTEKLIKTGKQTAIISFIIGTGIFGLYFLSSSDILLFLGYGFIVLAGITNFVIFILLLTRIYYDKTNKQKILSTCGLMLLNIPIMIIYIWIAIILLNTMRITFNNTSKTTYTNIQIIGCETESIKKLEAGESKTVWIGITGDCSLSIIYGKNGVKKTETVMSYVTNNMGQNLSYTIEGGSEIIF